MDVTIPQLMEQTVLRFADKKALYHNTANGWIGRSWQHYYDDVNAFAKGLIALGFEEKSSLAILSFNCPEWVIGNLGGIFASGVCLGIYPTSSNEQIEYILNHSEASFIIVEDKKQLLKIKAIQSKLLHLKQIIVIKPCERSGDSFLFFSEVLMKGKKENNKELTRRINTQKPDDLSTLVYTSGTTANPKGVMLSHRNLTWIAKINCEHDLKITSTDEVISYLPLSHIAEQLVSIYGPLASGACVWFAESLEKLPKNLLDVRPTIFLGVPRIWEKIEASMKEKAAKSSFFKKMLLNIAKDIGLKNGYKRQDGSSFSFSFQLADKIIYKKVRKALGLDRCRMQVTAAAPIGKETLEFFLSLNVPLCEVYGMSECSGPASVSVPGESLLGKAGKKVFDTELKIADDGEILVRGRHVFSGYFKDEIATKEVLDRDGWLHSGDLGEMDSEGYLSITGRKKNLIITAGGENIAPEMLENKIKSINGIDQVVVIGDRQKYLSALLTLSPVAVSIAKNLGSKAKTIEDLSSCERFKKYLDEQMEQINNNVAQVQTIKRFSVLKDTFSEATGELTPTMKVKRNVVLKKYEKEIDKFY